MFLRVNQGSTKGRIKWNSGIVELSCSTSSSCQANFSFLESPCCCFSSCRTDLLLLFGSHIFFMRGPEEAALNVYLLWISLIELSSLMTPHRSGHPHGGDNTCALWKLYLIIEGRREAELAHVLRRLGDRWERTLNESSCLLKNNQQEISSEGQENVLISPIQKSQIIKVSKSDNNKLFWKEDRQYVATDTFHNFESLKFPPSNLNRNSAVDINKWHLELWKGKVHSRKWIYCVFQKILEEILPQIVLRLIRDKVAVAMAVCSPWHPKFKYHEEAILNTNTVKELQLIQKIACVLDIIQMNRNIWSKYFTEILVFCGGVYMNRRLIF